MRAQPAQAGALSSIATYIEILVSSEAKSGGESCTTTSDKIRLLGFTRYTRILCYLLHHVKCSSTLRRQRAIPPRGSHVPERHGQNKHAGRQCAASLHHGRHPFPAFSSPVTTPPILAGYSDETRMLARGGIGGQLPGFHTSAPASLAGSPTRMSLSCSPSRRLVEGRRRTWVVESTSPQESALLSRINDWGPARDAGSDTDCDSEPPSPQRTWHEQIGSDTTTAWDKLVALPQSLSQGGRGLSPLSARNGEQASPFSCARSPFSCDAPKRCSPIERLSPA